jgi:hypothetical protein
MRALVGALGIALASRDADACVFIGDPGFEAGTFEEATPPSAVTIGEVTVSETDIPEPGCGMHPDSCSGIRFTSARVRVSATDNTTESFDLGYRVRVVRGTGFKNIDLYDRLATGGAITLTASDIGDLDTELGISAIDASGNVGPETVLRIVYHFDGDGGCRTGPGRPLGAFALALGTLALLLRRRR